MKVLIADDEKKICALINHLIDWASLGMELLGYTHDGQATLQAIIEQQPDIVITDIRMPGLSGLEVIKAVREQGMDTEFVVISGFKHFEYAKQAMQYGISNYLLKPINSEELAYTLQDIRHKYHTHQAQAAHVHQLQMLSDQTKNIVRKDTLLQLLQQPTQEHLARLNLEAHFQFQAGWFQLVSLKIDGIRELQHHLPYFNQKLSYWFSSLGQCHELEFVFVEGYFVLLVNYTDIICAIHKEQLKQLLTRLQDQQEVFQDFSVTAALGKPAETLLNALAELPHTLQALDQRLLHGLQKVYDTTPTYTDSHLPVALVQIRSQFLAALDIQNSDTLAQLSEEALKVLLADEALTTAKQSGTFPLTGHDCLLFFRRLFNDFTRRLEQHATLGLVWLSASDFFVQARQLGSLAEVEHFFSTQITQTFTELRAYEQQHVSRPIIQAKAFLRQNFHLPITLEEVASQVGLSPSYLSTLFKNQTEETFSEYLLRKRMEAAKRQLRDSKHTVAHICEQVGYTDIKHFTKSFKKTTGLLPKDYRKLYQ